MKASGSELSDPCNAKPISIKSEKSNKSNKSEKTQSYEIIDEIHWC